MKRDVEATKREGFSDWRSYVAKDGRWVLYGGDWMDQKARLRERCKGRCEQWVGKWGGENHDQCRSEAADPHHIIPRSKGRDDRLTNLKALCRLHHELLDERKPRFGEKTKPVQKRRHREEAKS